MIKAKSQHLQFIVLGRPHPYCDVDSKITALHSSFRVSRLALRFSPHAQIETVHVELQELHIELHIASEAESAARNPLPAFFHDPVLVFFLLTKTPALHFLDHY